MTFTSFFLQLLVEINKILWYTNPFLFWKWVEFDIPGKERPPPKRQNPLCRVEILNVAHLYLRASWIFCGCFQSGKIWPNQGLGVGMVLEYFVSAEKRPLEMYVTRLVSLQLFCLFVTRPANTISLFCRQTETVVPH